jgi:hypothetical protein
MGHVATPVVYRYSPVMRESTPARRARRSRRALADLGDVLSNVCVAVGLLFLIALGLDLRLGTPQGLAGFVSGIALVAAGFAQIAVPARLRRAGRSHAVRPQTCELVLNRFVA